MVNGSYYSGSIAKPRYPIDALLLPILITDTATSSAVNLYVHLPGFALLNPLFQCTGCASNVVLTHDCRNNRNAICTCSNHVAHIAHPDAPDRNEREICRCPYPAYTFQAAAGFHIALLRCEKDRTCS
jgi:hypothetical protein